MPAKGLRASVSDWNGSHAWTCGEQDQWRHELFGWRGSPPACCGSPAPQCADSFAAGWPRRANASAAPHGLYRRLELDLGSRGLQPATICMAPPAPAGLRGPALARSRRHTTATTAAQPLTLSPSFQRSAIGRRRRLGVAAASASAGPAGRVAPRSPMGIRCADLQAASTRAARPTAVRLACHLKLASLPPRPAPREGASSPVPALYSQHRHERRGRPDARDPLRRGPTTRLFTTR